MNAVSYFVNSSTIAANSSSSNSTYLANAFGQSGRYYLLPAIYSPVTQQCITAPIVPTQAACSAQPVSSRVGCLNPLMVTSMSEVPTTQQGCSAVGCCWDSAAKFCYISDTNVTSPVGVSNESAVNVRVISYLTQQRLFQVYLSLYPAINET